MTVSLSRFHAARMLCLGFLSRLLAEAAIASHLSPPLTADIIISYSRGTIRTFITEVTQNISSFFSDRLSPLVITSASNLLRTSAAKLMQLVWLMVDLSEIVLFWGPERDFAEQRYRFERRNHGEPCSEEPGQCRIFVWKETSRIL